MFDLINSYIQFYNNIYNTLSNYQTRFFEESFFNFFYFMKDTVNRQDDYYHDHLQYDTNDHFIKEREKRKKDWSIK